MWHDMFVEQIPIAEKLLRTVFVYALVTILVRATGKRGLAALNTLDFVVMFLLSNVVQNAIIGPDNSVLGGIIGAVTLVIVNSALNRAALRYALFAKIFDGTATTVIKDGEVQQRAVRRLGLRRAELDHAVRMQNGDDIRQVESGSLEPGGQLLLTLRETEQGATKADVDELRAQLDRIEAALAGRPAGS
ncbi:DUF421 domain-containing protein [uncultured Jatrophihabitans sp.]|uniref:DUF421 domain-containing protein n=1 Tax=uncultured Jatrophihabitans sp. TaxID=1610747 RepID=UPI0035CC48CA